MITAWQLALLQDLGTVAVRFFLAGSGDVDAATELEIQVVVSTTDKSTNTAARSPSAALHILCSTLVQASRVYKHLLSAADNVSNDKLRCGVAGQAG
jgi:hypothetical protein